MVLQVRACIVGEDSVLSGLFDDCMCRWKYGVSDENKPLVDLVWRRVG